MNCKKRFLLLLLISGLCLSENMAQQLPFNKGIRILSPKFFPGWQAQHVNFPFVTYDTAMGLFRMYYAGSSSTQVNESLWDQWVTGIATSRNSLEWRGPDDYEQILFAQKLMEGDVINPDEQSKIFDAVYAVDACVIKDGPGYKCWYMGWNGEVEHVGGGITRKKNFRIGYASSTDGWQWNKQPGAVLSGEDPFVIKENNNYRMWYVENEGQSRKIHYAVSSDGLSWTKKGAVTGFTEQEAQNPVIIKRAGQYELWYQGKYNNASQTHIGRAVSADGVSWKKVNDLTLHPEAPQRAGRYSPWTSVSPDAGGKLVLGNVIVLPDNSCQVFYAKQYTVNRELTYGKRSVPISFIYTERINP